MLFSICLIVKQQPGKDLKLDEWSAKHRGISSCTEEQRPLWGGSITKMIETCWGFYEIVATMFIILTSTILGFVVPWVQPSTFWRQKLHRGHWGLKDPKVILFDIGWSPTSHPRKKKVSSRQRSKFIVYTTIYKQNCLEYSLCIYSLVGFSFSTILVQAPLLPARLEVMENLPFFSDTNSGWWLNLKKDKKTTIIPTRLWCVVGKKEGYCSGT